MSSGSGVRFIIRKKNFFYFKAPVDGVKKTCQHYRWRYRGTYPRDTKILTIATSQPETNNSASGKENDTTDFPITAPAANPVFYRTYSRKLQAGRESWEQVNARNLDGLKKLGD